MEDQFDSIDMGIISVVNKTKYMDKPSNPKNISNILRLWCCWTNWYWLIEKSNVIYITRDKTKFTKDEYNARSFIQWDLLIFILNISNIPIKGIIINATNILVDNYLVT